MTGHDQKTNPTASEIKDAEEAAQVENDRIDFIEMTEREMVALGVTGYEVSGSGWDMVWTRRAGDHSASYGITCGETYRVWTEKGGSVERGDSFDYLDDAAEMLLVWQHRVETLTTPVDDVPRRDVCPGDVLLFEENGKWKEITYVGIPEGRVGPELYTEDGGEAILAPEGLWHSRTWAYRKN